MSQLCRCCPPQQHTGGAAGALRQDLIRVLRGGRPACCHIPPHQAPGTAKVGGIGKVLGFKFIRRKLLRDVRA